MRTEASSVVWDWRNENVSRSKGPSAKQLRLRGVLQSGVTFVAAVALAWFGLRHMAIVAGVIGSVVLLAALVSPTGLFAALLRGMDALAAKFGALLNRVLLGAIFFGFFVPFGRLFRRGRRDALSRFYEPEATTYWIDREDESLRAPGSRKRQY